MVICLLYCWFQTDCISILRGVLSSDSPLAPFCYRWLRIFLGQRILLLWKIRSGLFGAYCVACIHLKTRLPIRIGSDLKWYTETGQTVCFKLCIDSVSKLKLVLSVTFLIFLVIFEVLCVKLAHSSSGDPEDISITHPIIIIKTEVSIIPNVVIFSVVVPQVVVLSNAVVFTYIPGKLNCVSFITVQSYDVRK